MMKGYRLAARMVYSRCHSPHSQQLRIPPPAVLPNVARGSYCSSRQVGDVGREAVDKTMERGRNLADKGKEGGEQLAGKGREMMDKTKEGSQHVAEKGKEAMGGILDDHTDSDNSNVAGEVKSSTSTILDHAKKEMNTARDMVADMPQKVSETTAGVQEVGVEAAKAIKRDASKLAERAGLKGGESHKDEERTG